MMAPMMTAQESLSDLERGVRGLKSSTIAGGIGGRHFGIQNAKGDSFLFVDGDDWPEPDYASFLIGFTEKTNTT